jgi:hypothetical protein
LASVVDEKSHRHSPTKAYFLAQHQPEVPLPDGVAILTKLDCLEFECNKAEDEYETCCKYDDPISGVFYECWSYNGLSKFIETMLWH